MGHPAQLLNLNHFRQRCMKARPDTPIPPYYSNRQIAFALFARSGAPAPGGIRTPGLLVRSAISAYTRYKPRQRNATKQREFGRLLCSVWYPFVWPSRTEVGQLTPVGCRNMQSSRPLKLRECCFREWPQSHNLLSGLKRVGMVSSSELHYG